MRYSLTLSLRKYNDIADWKWTQLLDTLGDRLHETKSFKVANQKELEALLTDNAFLNADCPTLVEVIMDRLDAPRLLADSVAVNEKRMQLKQ